MASPAPNSTSRLRASVGLLLRRYARQVRVRDPDAGVAELGPSVVLVSRLSGEAMKDRTAIVIAHRLSTVRRMDRLVVLEAGRIVEQGTHEELLANRGPYAALWEHQSGGFIE